MTLPKKTAADSELAAQVTLINYQVDLANRSVSSVSDALTRVVERMDERFKTLENDSIKRHEFLNATITTKFDELAQRSKPNVGIWWSAGGVILTALVVIGGLLWYPIKQGQDVHGSRLLKLESESVSAATLVQREKLTDYIQEDTRKRLEKIEKRFEDRESEKTATQPK